MVEVKQVEWFVCQENYKTQWICEQDCCNMNLDQARWESIEVLVWPSSSLFISALQFLPQLLWHCFQRLSIFRDNDDLLQCQPAVPIRVDFFVMRDVSQGCQWLPSSPMLMTLLLWICFWLLTDLQPCIMKNVVHMHDLGAKAMSDQQIRRRSDSNVPWQAQAKEPIKPIRWFVPKTRLTLSTYYVFSIHMCLLHTCILFIRRGAHHSRHDSNPS